MTIYLCNARRLDKPEEAPGVYPSVPCSRGNIAAVGIIAAPVHGAPDLRVTLFNGGIWACDEITDDEAVALDYERHVGPVVPISAPSPAPVGGTPGTPETGTGGTGGTAGDQGVATPPTESVESLAGLLVRWAELAPDECDFSRPILASLSPHEWTAYLTTMEPGALYDGVVFQVTSDDGPTAEACVLWHVLTCMQRRGMKPQVFAYRNGAQPWGSYDAAGGRQYGADDPALAALTGYVAALSSAHSPEAPASTDGQAR